MVSTWCFCVWCWIPCRPQILKVLSNAINSPISSGKTAKYAFKIPAFRHRCIMCSYGFFLHIFNTARRLQHLLSSTGDCWLHRLSYSFLLLVKTTGSSIVVHASVFALRDWHNLPFPFVRLFHDIQIDLYNKVRAIPFQTVK